VTSTPVTALKLLSRTTPPDSATSEDGVPGLDAVHEASAAQSTTLFDPIADICTAPPLIEVSAGMPTVPASVAAMVNAASTGVPVSVWVMVVNAGKRKALPGPVAKNARASPSASA
jgi:hypothetical protein